MSWGSGGGERELDGKLLRGESGMWRVANSAPFSFSCHFPISEVSSLLQRNFPHRCVVGSKRDELTYNVLFTLVYASQTRPRIVQLPVLDYLISSGNLISRRGNSAHLWSNSSLGYAEKLKTQITSDSVPAPDKELVAFLYDIVIHV